VDLVSTPELVLQLQDGSLEALGQLYKRFNQLVYRTAYGISGDPDTAADLLQDVFLRLHRFAERVDPSRPLEPWLYRVTTNLAYTRVKRRRWLRPLDDVADWLSSKEKKPSVHYLVELDDEWQQVNRAIGTLPLPQRIVVVLYYVNDLSIIEIADILEIPQGTVKSRLHYGRKTLKKIIGSQGELFSEGRYEFT
jgi:RNA polymerase sigma-70 factor (ECF subfamily)